ncbi:TTC28 [Branchiostoma lanceolatum]|uniref:TTC28 protein n=1 Tax=Branchiostoma lanceolatum TaxID=7740 RepID=A0A8K0ABE5_BRALA|nr:TTC28 [Branchiostoma lanceolatum]
MLRVCEKLREVDAKARRLGLVRTETDYLRALLDAMADMDRAVEVEVLKSLGDVNLEKGQVDRAMLLYRTALLRCKDADVGDSLQNRYRYAEKLRVGRGGTIPDDYEPQTNHEKMSSPAKVAEKFLHLDRRSTSGYDRDSVLIEYINLMIEGIINEDNLSETEAIKSLGDLFLKRGTETRDAPCLTKATALYNTALARCERVQGTVALIHRLLYTARIRQDMKTTANKGPKLRQRQQQQRGHMSRDFPVTSSNTEVIGDAKGHKFMSPSEYISSLTPKHVPDYRSYEKYLTAGDRAVADGNLDLAERKFAAALKLIHDPNKPDRRKEADCMCRLGDVYARGGKITKEGRNFTQAAALYNAAMARTDKDKHSVTKRLQEIEQWFLRYTANVDSTSIPSDQAIRHRERLDEISAHTKAQLEAIDQEHDPYRCDEDDPCMKTVEAERAEAVKALFKTIAKNRQRFIQDLVDECIVVLGPPPCKYAFIGLGSQATELVTPYSDLEFAILIEDGKDVDDTRRYFLNLTHYLHLKVIILGETILPAMAIPSLNDFQSEDPEKDWFFDSVTPRGFAFDGFMPWASKTPFGRDKTKSKPRLSLIQTPNEMAKFQQLDISVSEGYHLSDILRRFVFLAGEKELVNEYGGELSEIITSDLSSHFQSHLSALQLLYDNKDHFANHEPTGQLLNVKKDIYRFPGIAIELLALCCKVTHSSAWDVIDRLKEMEKIGEENATHLTVLTSISAELRLRTYIANGGQKDSLSPLVQMENKSETREVPDSILRSVFYIPNTKVLFRYYCRAIPLKQCIPGMVKEGLQSTGLIKMAIYDVSNECLGRIANNLFLSQRSIRHLKAALDDAGSDAIKRSEIFRELGKYWESEGDFTKAKLNFEQSLTLRRGIYGDNTAELGIAESLHNLGIIWNDLGDRKKAIDYFERSLAMTKTIYGDNTAHPLIAGALGKLGSCWGRLGDETKAITYFEQSLAMMKTIYGDNTAHPHIAQLLHHLGGHGITSAMRRKQSATLSSR